MIEDDAKPFAADGGGGGTLYPGTIAAANADGTFAVRYEDGDEEEEPAAQSWSERFPIPLRQQ